MMSLKSFVLFAVVGAAALTAHRSYSSPASAAMTAPSPTSSVVADVAEIGAVERVTAFVGRVGAVVAGPVVRSMSKDTRRLLADLDPAIGRAPAQVARRAREVSKQLLQADSAAHDRLAEGQPMEALRYAMYSKGLIPSVRQIVAEETAFRP